MIPSTLCWLALHVSLARITPKSQISKNTEQKGAPKQHGTTTASRSDPNPRELKPASLQKHPTKRSIAFGHKNRGRIIASRLASFWQQRTLKV
jgi:hypothetical protein